MSAPQRPARVGGYGHGHGHGHDVGHGQQPPPYWMDTYYRPPQRDPNHPHVTKAQRRWAVIYYIFRNFSIAIPVVLIVININIYATNRGRFATDGAPAADPVYLDLYLTVPLSAVHLLWGLFSMCLQRRRFSAISQSTCMGIEIMFGLGALVCFALMVAHIVAKANDYIYTYPYKSVEGAMAFLIGLLMTSDFLLAGRAWYEGNREREFRDRSVVM